MNLALLDREQLEDILLNPVAGYSNDLRCSEAAPLDCLPAGGTERRDRIRQVMAAAHELLVRTANAYLVGRSMLNAPSLVKDYLKVHFAGAERESFVVIFLDPRMQVIATEELFAGTLTQTSVYPREVVKRALELGAAAVVLAHNHISGHAEPSRADEHLTLTLKSALNLLDVRVVDHIVVSGSTCVSFAERGLL